MSTPYTVKQGDCMSSIAHEKGFFWKTLWDHPDNADLKKLRKNPNVLLEQDTVAIPDLRKKEESRASDAKYTFVRKGIPEKLRLKLFDAHHKPRANLDYILDIDGKQSKGKTNGQGELIESISPSAKAGKILLGKDRSEVIPLNLGHLDPVSEISGQQARLANLGLYNGPIDGKPSVATTKAIRAFQTKQGLPVTGTADDATTAQLEKTHGH